MVQVQLLTRFIFVLLFSYRGDQDPTKTPTYRPLSKSLFRFVFRFIELLPLALLIHKIQVYVHIFLWNPHSSFLCAL